MRRLIMLGVTTAALALPVAALAANSDTGFTLPQGANTSRAFRIHVASTGRVQVTFRFSNVVNPHGRFRITIRKLSWTTPVVMLDTPGHTPGHHSLMVRLKEKGTVILSGDMAHFHENYDSNGVPGFNWNRAATLASLDRVKKLAANMKATVIIQHDTRDIGMLPAFPAAAR